MRHTQIQASGDQGVFFEEVLDLNFEDMAYPRQMRVFPLARIAQVKIWRKISAFRKSNSVVRVKGRADKTEEVVESSL